MLRGLRAHPLSKIIWHLSVEIEAKATCNINQNQMETLGAAR
jgi:hypothetical protein